jgi:hypothetical protein
MSHKQNSALNNSEYYESTKGYGGTNSAKEADLFISNKETKSYGSTERDQQLTKVRQKSQRSTSKDDFDNFDPRANGNSQ